MNMPPIVSPQEWEAAREELLVKEKELTRARDALAAERRRMPRMAVEKDYRFEGPDGPASLLDLFEGRRQLIVYRFFFEPGVAGWPESGCRRLLVHGRPGRAPRPPERARHHLRRTSRAPRRPTSSAGRRGWAGRSPGTRSPTTSTPTSASTNGTAPTPSTATTTDRIFRTYFIDKRGDEALGSAWAYLDITALGRQEKWEDSPEGYPQTEPYGWWNLHDEYDDARLIFAHVGGVPVEEPPPASPSAARAEPGGS